MSFILAGGKYNYQPKFAIFVQKSQKGEFSDFYGFTLYMILVFLLKMAISIMTIFMKNCKNHI